jgi:hypothetical protein
MAVSQVILVRRLTDEPDTTTYSDAELTDRLTDASVNAVSLGIWTEKLAGLASLVDISEGGSQRKMSQAYDHAKSMIDLLTVLVDTENAPTTTIRKITRV